MAALLLARDEKNVLAVIRRQLSLSAVATFREGPVRAGDVVVALGYPLSGLLATTANLTVGNVSALAGLSDDSRYLQISAPVQLGNSGGPLLDASGHIVGIVTAKLDAALVARFLGDIPQNVNFALKAEVARTFLDSLGIPYQSGHSDVQLPPADVGDIARPFTVEIECYSAPSESMADLSRKAYEAAQPPEPPETPPTAQPNSSYRVTADLHLRGDAAPDSPDILGPPPNDVMPKDSKVAVLDISTCKVWDRSGRGSLDADNVWCPVIYGTLHGWANALYLGSSDGLPLACRLYPASRGCNAYANAVAEWCANKSLAWFCPKKKEGTEGFRVIGPSDPAR